MITDAQIALYMDDYQLLLVERGAARKRRALVTEWLLSRQSPTRWPSPWKFRTDLGPVYRERWHARSRHTPSC